VPAVAAMTANQIRSMIESVIDFAQPVVQRTKCYHVLTMPGVLSQKLQIPVPKSQEKFNRQILKR
jgi:hypothetical protein